jgi:hypothetical protein
VKFRERRRVARMFVDLTDPRMSALDQAGNENLADQPRAAGYDDFRVPLHALRHSSVLWKIGAGIARMIAMITLQ